MEQKAIIVPSFSDERRSAAFCPILYAVLKTLLCCTDLTPDK